MKKMETPGERFSRPRFKFGTSNATPETTRSSIKDLFSESKTQNYGDVLKRMPKNDSKQLRDLQDSITQLTRENEILENSRDLKENRSKTIRELSVLLNDFYHKNISVVEFMKEGEITNEQADNIITQYNEFIDNQIASKLTSNILLEKAHSLEEYSRRITEMLIKIEEKKNAAASIPTEESTQFIIEQIKRRHRFLKKQYDELDEFLRAEVDAKKQQAKNTIYDLETALSSFNSEMENLKLQLIRQRSCLVNDKLSELQPNVDMLETSLKEKEDKIRELSLENANTQGKIVQARNRIKQLIMKRDALKAIAYY